MKKFAALVAFAALSTAFAGSASAATLVRVNLAGKNSVEINNEIKAAAQTVCASEKASFAHECFETTVSHANRQLAGILKARSNTAAPARGTVNVVRVSLKGKSTEQIHAEIRTAAEAVCKASKDVSNRNDYQACVGGAVRAAKAQLQALAAQPKTQA